MTKFCSKVLEAANDATLDSFGTKACQHVMKWWICNRPKGHTGMHIRVSNVYDCKYGKNKTGVIMEFCVADKITSIHKSLLKADA